MYYYLGDLMRWGARLGMVAVVTALLLTPLLSPTLGYGGKKVPVSVTWIAPLKKEVKTVIISEKDAEVVKEMLQDAEASLKIISQSTNEEEKAKAMEVIENLIGKLKKLDLIPAGLPVRTILLNLFNPKFAFILPILSFGSGLSWIPLYPGEAFIGFMFRPILMQYFIFGYTGTLNVNLVPPRIEYWDMVGTHTLIVLGFVGVYIDFGKIGYGVPNLQFLFGEALFAGGIDWI